MGLDMYLSAKKFHSDAGFRGPENNKEFQKLKKMSGVGSLMTKDLPHIYLEVSVGYWRKQNAIHQWFVDNCQNGEDDCRAAYVSREKLKELKALCKKVLKNKDSASEELPTTQGFFFGSEEYDEWYFQGLEETVEIIDRCLKMPAEWEFEYHSSW